jgi:hypothetical protein
MAVLMMSSRANCVIMTVSAGEKPMIIGAPATKQANPRQVCFGSIFCFGAFSVLAAFSVSATFSFSTTFC